MIRSLLWNLLRFLQVRNCCDVCAILSEYNITNVQSNCANSLPVFRPLCFLFSNGATNNIAKLPCYCYRRPYRYSCYMKRRLIFFYEHKEVLWCAANCYCCFDVTLQLGVPPIQATKALRVGRGIALPYLRPWHWRWGWVVSTTLRPLYSLERPGTHCTGGWVSPRAGQNGCRKSRPHRDSIPGLSRMQRVAIPTELSRPRMNA